MEFALGFLCGVIFGIVALVLLCLNVNIDGEERE